MLIRDRELERADRMREEKEANGEAKSSFFIKQFFVPILLF